MNEAKHLAAESSGWEKENYEAIVKSLERLLEGPPQNFREACQLLAIFQNADRSYYAGGALGQLALYIRIY